MGYSSRRQVLVVLNACGGEMTAGDIAGCSCSWPTTSRHLRVPEETELVRVQGRGWEGVCVLDKARICKLVGSWTGSSLKGKER